MEENMVERFQELVKMEDGLKQAAIQNSERMMV